MKLATVMRPFHNTDDDATVDPVRAEHERQVRQGPPRARPPAVGLD